MTKKTTEIAKLQSSEVQVIPSKEELQIGMRKTLKELDEKLVNLTGPADRLYKVSNITIREGGYEVTIDVKNSVELQHLIKAVAQIKRVKREHLEVIKDLKIEVPCLIGGINADVWIEDIEFRIKSVYNVKTIAEIKAAKARLETFLSEEDRLIQTLSEVEKLLK